MNRTINWSVGSVLSVCRLDEEDCMKRTLEGWISDFLHVVNVLMSVIVATKIGRTMVTIQGH